MRAFLLTLYTAWAAFCFVVVYLFIFPFQFIFLQKRTWKPLAHRCNRLWAELFFPLIGIPVYVRYEGSPPEKDSAFVFASNHFSYLDIPVFVLVVRHYFAFVGKLSVKNVPLLGYMFMKLHIQVDRADPQSRAKSLARSYRALQTGRSVVVYPEGGIKTKEAPAMFPALKDGAFKMAISQQVAIVPITLLDNYLRLPDAPKIRLVPGKIRVVFHHAIPTTGMDETHVEELKSKFFAVVQTTLDTPPQDGFKRVTIW